VNIYALDEHPELAARYHNDRHVAKQINEVVQVLCTAHIMIDGDVVASRTLKNNVKAVALQYTRHPWVLWAQASSFNYSWLHQLGEALLKEYSTRFGKVHYLHELMNLLRTKPMLIECTAMRTPWPQCLPEQYRDTDPIEAYRNYYRGDKQHLATWSAPSSVPWWWDAHHARGVRNV